MTTDTTLRAHALDVSDTARTPFLRLVAVEWRKIADTRAGRWLLGITAGLVLLITGLVLLVADLEDEAISHRAWFEEILLLPFSLLIPVLAIMCVTSEWSQRTAMVTFALEPQRSRVIAAKAVVVAGIGLASLLACYLCSLAGTALNASLVGADADWDLTTERLVWTVAVSMLTYASAFGLSLLLLSTPAAIAVIYVVQMVLPIVVYLPLMGIFSWGPDVVPWLDLTHASVPLYTDDPQTGEPINMIGQPVERGALEWARFGFTIVLWVLAPVTAGLARVLRAEVK